MPNNLKAGPQVAIPTEDKTFAAAGVTAQNTNIIYAFDPLRNYVPGRPFNGLTSFTAGEGVLIDMKLPADMSSFMIPPVPGVTDPDPDPVTNAKYNMAGAPQTMSVANPTDFNLTGDSPFTIGFLAKLPTNTSKFLFGRTADADESYWAGMLINNGHPYVGLLMRSSANDYIFNRDNGDDGAATPLALDTYYDVIITFDGNTTAKIIINTAERTVETIAGTFGSLQAVGSFKFGQSNLNHSNAVVDEAFFLNRVMTNAEILERNNGGNVKPINTVSTISNADLIDGWLFNNNLQSIKGTHNGTATTPQYTTT